MDQQQALKYAQGMIDAGMSVADANIELVRMMGVRIVSSGLDRGTRLALMAGVKGGRLGRLPKSGTRPEAFFHPNALWNAKEQRDRIANAAIRSLLNICI
jgi:hypothetical protein